MLAVGLAMQAQQVAVSAQIDSTSIWIGQQCELTLTATVPNGQRVNFPLLKDSVKEGVEIVGEARYDTSMVDGMQQIKAHYTLTSFEDTLHYISPFAFLQGQDTLLTEPLTLDVIQPFELDSTDESVTDIKPVEKPDIWWWGILRWVLLGLVVAGLIALGVWYYLRWKKQKAEQVVEEPEVIRTPQEIALEQLDRIREEKIWVQDGRQKQYYTELTDVVREYIDRLYQLGSTEKTSYEILRDLQPLMGDKEVALQHLKSLLTKADLAKFAKWKALPDENEQSLREATNFIVMSVQ